MDLQEHIGKENMPSILKDPFKKVLITRVYVNYREFCGKWSSHGLVEFRNGNTSGTQNFHGDTFDDVVAQIKAFVKDLE